MAEKVILGIINKKHQVMKKALGVKEQTTADASGSVESPVFGKTILKKDIHKIHNTKKKEIDEVVSADASGSYDAPIGHGSKNPLKIDNPKTVNRETRAVKDKKFPKFGGPDGKFVEVKEKCKKFPYCNQGDMNALTIYESKELKKVIQEVSVKYKIAPSKIEKMIYKKYGLSEGIEDVFTDPGNKKAIEGWFKEEDGTTYILRTKEPIEISTTDRVDIAKLKSLFYKFDIDFDIEEIKS